jgi:hypothetical protein
VCGSNADASPSGDATVADANAGDASPNDDAPSNDVAELDSSDAAPSDFGSPTVACSFTVVNPLNEEVYRVASGPSGKIAAVGYFGASFDASGVPVDFGDGTKITIPDGSESGGFVFTLDTSCKVVWARAIEFGTNVAFDSKGNIWTASVRNGASLVSILTKFDPLGNILFQTTFGSASGRPSGYVAITKIGVDATDSVIFGGEYSATPSVGGSPLPDNTTGTFVAKLDASGAHVWSKGFGGAAQCQRTPTALAIDPAGNVLVAGVFGNVTCDLSFGGPTLVSTTLFSGFAARLSGADGGHIWSEAVQGAQVSAATVTGSGYIYVAGTLSAPQDLGSGVVDAGPFAARLAPDGGRVWGGAYPWGYVEQIVSGGSLGERAVVAATQAPSLQVVESDGGTGWSFLPPSAPGYASIASGANRDIVFGGFVRPTTADVYVLRLTR